MKKNIPKNISPAVVFIFAIVAFAGCGSSSEDRNADQSSNTPELITENFSGTNLGTDSDTDDEPESGVTPSAPETITEEAAGTVYYSEPNRMVLFYGDAEVTGEYPPVGSFDNTEEFRSAVENNPVLESWGNKIVLISDGD